MKTNNIAAPHAGPSRLPDSKLPQAPPPRQSWRSRGLTLAAKSAACLAALCFAGLSGASAANLLTDPGFEDGGALWSPSVLRFGTGTLVNDPATAHDGSNYFSATGVGGWASVMQGDTRGAYSTGSTTMSVNSAAFYKLSAWVKVPGAATTPQAISLRYRFEPSGNRVDVGTQTISTEDWTYLESGYIQPGSSDTFMSYFEVHSQTNDVTMYVDDCAVTEYPPMHITGRVIDGLSAGVDGAAVAATSSTYSSPVATTAGGGYYTLSVSPFADTYTVKASSPGFKGSISGLDVSSDPTAAPDITLDVDPDYDSDLIFSVRSSAASATAPWPCAFPASNSLARIGAPGVETIGSQQWVKNLYTTGDGYRFGTFTDPITVNGASVVAVVKPQYRVDGGWGSVVNVFMNDLRLDVNQVSGRVTVVRKGQGYDGPVLLDGQKAVLSAIVQPTGEVSLYVNGTRVINNLDAPGYMQMTPGNWNGGVIETQPWAHAINVGRNDPDGWSAYNGNIGDIYVYKVALDDTKRAALESDLMTKFDVKQVINASAGAHGTIDPLGLVEVSNGADQTFTFAADSGYAIASVLIDGVANAQAKIDGTYTFTNVIASHTIAVSFENTSIDPNLPIVDISVDSGFTDDAGLTVWPNAGTLEGQFVAGDGFDTIAPMTRANIGGIKAVQFNGSKMLLSSTTSTADRIMAPASITGAGSKFTVVANVYAPGSGLYDPWEQFFLAWSRRNGPELSCASFGYGKGWWGAIGGWGAGDVNYGALYPSTDRSVAPAWGQWNTVAMTYDGATVKIYYNGAVVNTQTKAYAFHANMPISLGSQYSGDTGLGRDLAFNGSIAALKIYSRELTGEEIIAATGTRHTITASAGTGGSISPSPSVSVQTGTTSPTFTITPAYGYEIGPVTVTENGIPTEYPATATYTFTNVIADGSINATFIPLPTFSGVVSGPSGPIFSAKVALSPGNFVWTNSAGEYLIVPPGDGEYTLTASKGGYVSGSIPATMAGSSIGGLDITLAKSAGLDPLVVLDASTLTDPDGTRVLSWANDGSLGGVFNKKAAGPGPSIATILDKKAVQFSPAGEGDNVSETLGGTIVTPPEVAGNSDWSVSTDLYKVDMNNPGGDQAYLSLASWWGHPVTGFGTSAQFCYRNNKAVDHNGSGWGFAIVPTAGAWHNVTITYDGTTQKVYVDGVLDESRAIALNIATGDQMLVGSHSDVAGSDRIWNDNYWRYTGSIAKLQIFDQALTLAEVQALNGIVSTTITGSVKEADIGAENVIVTTTPGGLTGTTDVNGVYTITGATAGVSYTLTASNLPLGKMVDTAPATFVALETPNTGKDFTLKDNPDSDPDLLFLAKSSACVGNAPWPLAYSSFAGISAMTPMGTPSVGTIGSEPAAANDAEGDGFHVTNIPMGTNLTTNGASIVVVAKPAVFTPGNAYQDIVSVLLDQLSIGIQRDTGEVTVKRKGGWYNTGYFVADGESVILSLVVQPTGPLAVYANGVKVFTRDSLRDMSFLTASAWYMTDINVGKAWNGDGWSSYNGNIGDVYVYKTAIDDVKRKTLQSDLATKFGITLPTLHTITASADANGTISPSGAVEVAQGQDKTFNFYPTAGFVDVVTVDGTPEPGHPASYTFFNVTGPHTISVTFTVAPPPANDNFVDAIDLTGVEAGQTGAVTAGTQAGTYNFAATKEVDEPAFLYTGPDYEQSVWFKWTAPSNGNFTIDTYGTMNVAGQVWDSVIYLYDGASLATLNSLATVDNGQAETATIPVTTGTTYYVRLAWGGGPSGNAAIQRDTLISI